MKSHELLEVIGEAQDSYVLDAKAPRKKSTPVWLKCAAMAACLCLVFTMIYPFLRRGNWLGTEKPAKLHLVGTVLQTGDGTLTYHTDNFDKHILAFTLVLNHDIPYSYAAFNGYNILEEWTDEDGVVHQETELFKVITPCDNYEVGPEYTIIDYVLNITVNGEDVSMMPCTAGTYEIIIDYSELYQRMDVVDTRVELCPGGEIIINSDSFS